MIIHAISKPVASLDGECFNLYPTRGCITWCRTVRGSVANL